MCQEHQRRPHYKSMAIKTQSPPPQRHCEGLFVSWCIFGDIGGLIHCTAEETLRGEFEVSANAFGDQRTHRSGQVAMTSSNP